MTLEVNESVPLRTVKSFVRRRAKNNGKVQLHWAHLWPLYGLEQATLPRFVACLQGQPLMLEIGFGNGAVLAHMASQLPDTQFLGIEVYRAGVTQLMHSLRREEISNVKLCAEDVVPILEALPSGILQGVHLFFPDPWPKARHHKRRLVKSTFLALVKTKCAPNAGFYFRSDWPAYFEEVVSLLDADPDFCASPVSSLTYLQERPISKFEMKAQAKNHLIQDCLYRYQPSRPKLEGQAHS